MSERAFQNPYPDFNPHQPSGHFDTAGRLTPEFTQRLQNKIWELLQQMEKGLKSADPGDGTVYTGWAGIALLYLHLFKLFRDTSHLHKAQEYISKSLKCMSKQGVTFLCGDAGPLAVGAAVYYELQQEKEAEECIRRLLQMHQSAVKLDARMADELLYGRLGYLYALLFVNKRFNEEKIPASYIQQVCETILASGEGLARKRNLSTGTPLMYEWYREYYVGPAHGLSGIYYFLMQPDCGVCQDSLQRLVKPSVDFVNQLKFPSGNFPPCIDDTRDLLVHWCHGAPGVIYMLIQAYKMFREQSYLTSFLQCADVIWQRGLLKKGYGLCHGAAGNAYGFLALYNLTEDLKYLHRACMFADWCIDYGDHGCRTPDTPFSLFEGMAGTIYFLADMLEPNKAKFPAFEM
ncbi:glutathione S-transferase LANCL1 isoform X2 [Ambystoma mexicanum]|uniref:glutathione S-transferase LANCL1 isoform X2 n=1 Tax=Ambystoma mexicanum TaxID=8296 RepID=UPI0037E90919